MRSPPVSAGQRGARLATAREDTTVSGEYAENFRLPDRARPERRASALPRPSWAVNLSHDRNSRRRRADQPAAGSPDQRRVTRWREPAPARPAVRRGPGAPHGSGLGRPRSCPQLPAEAHDTELTLTDPPCSGLGLAPPIAWPQRPCCSSATNPW